MDRDLYKSSLNNLSVSKDVVDKVLQRAYGTPEARRGTVRARLFRLTAAAAAILCASVITVSAAAYLGASDVLGDFFSQLFSVEKNEMDKDQLDFLEQNGAAPGLKLADNGVSLNIDGIIGDRNYVFLKYTVSTEAKYSEDTLDAFLSPRLYIGKMHKGILPANCTVKTEPDGDDPHIINNAALFVPDTNYTPSFEITPGDTATFVMKSREVYRDMGINLNEAWEKCNSEASVKNSDLYGIPDGGLNIPFSNEYGGKIVLESIGFVGNKLVMGIHSDYYEAPKIFLREKSTGRIYYRCDGYLSVERDGMEIYPYDIESEDMLKNLEIVMLEEYHFSFPLSYKDSTKDLNISKEKPLKLGDATITRAMISPLSVRIEGMRSKDGAAIDANVDCTIRLKDQTILNYSGYGYCKSDETGLSFDTGLAFEKPVMLDSIEAIVIKHGGVSVEIPVN